MTYGVFQTTNEFPFTCVKRAVLKDNTGGTIETR
jgi:hypothetical protein